jgi:hypothetical protein
VLVGRIDGSPIGMPANWTRSDESTFCLACSRALAGETAVEAAPSGCTPKDLVRLRRSAVIEFEIGRTPEATNRVIAQACRTSGTVVGRVRDSLAHASEPSEPAGAGKG